MRDFSLMHRVADSCAAQKLNVRFDAVVPQTDFSHFTGCTGVTCRTGISEQALIRLYQEADALFLPVIDSTANNSVLEAMACGTPSSQPM
jgi:glycosyltransferase involved in cell wall biosynthesis